MPSETSPGGPLALYIHLLGGFHVSWGSQAIGEDAWPLRCQICWWSEVCPPHRKKASLLPFFHLFRQVWKNLYCVRNDRGKSHRASKINPSATRNVINKSSLPSTPATLRLSDSPNTARITTVRLNQIVKVA